MVVKTIVRKDAYYDSVTLMVGSDRMVAVEGVEAAMAFMGTPRNEKVIRESGLLESDELSFTANDTVIGIRAEDNGTVARAVEALDAYLSEKKAASDSSFRPKTISSAKRHDPLSNMVIVSVPGRYARHEVETAIDLDMHTLLFSDNVSLEDEIELKDMALDKGLFMMGPDCGTAIVNGVALGFANVVRRGRVGLVGAAGTGLQEVTVLIDCLGGGVSQAIGTGGRDVKEAVGGRMMLFALEALKHDEETDVIVLVSKPPHPSVLEKIKGVVADCEKPVVACLLGADREVFEGTDIHFAATLEEAATVAVELSGMTAKAVASQNIEAVGVQEAAAMSCGQRYVRGLFSGGTLCAEALLILEGQGLKIHSNIASDPAMLLNDVECSQEHTLVDMGDDFFTNGAPHPMIDPRLRVARIAREAADPEAAVLLLDCVGGFGSHEDPAGVLADAITSAKARAQAEGRHLSVVASVCATESDPQVRSTQEQILREAEAIVCADNAEAARVAASIVEKIGC